MIDERFLTDPATCPSCGNQLLGSSRCPTCRVDLAGPLGARVWELSVQAAALLDERRHLLDQLRSAATPVTAPAAAGATPVPPPATVLPPAQPPRPRPEWTRRRVQNLLLSLGAGLLAVAAVIFLIVSWSVLGVGGRAAVMAGCTVLAGAGAYLAHRARLTATAEAVAALTVGLGVLDAWGARSAGLAGLDRVDGAAYWAGAFAVLSAAAALGSCVVPARGLRLPAALFALLPLPLLTAQLVDPDRAPLAVTAAGLTLAAAAPLLTAARWPFGAATRDARLVLVAGGLATYVAAVGASLAAAFGEPGSLLAGTALLLVLAAATGLAGRRLGPVAAASTVVAALLVVAAAWAPAVVTMDGAAADWAPAVMAGAVVVLLAAAVLVPPDLRPWSVGSFVAALLVPALAAARPLAVVVDGQLGWWEQAWSVPAHAGAVEALRPSDPLAGLDRWGAEIPVLLLVVAAGLALLPTLHRRVLPVGRQAAESVFALAAALLAAAVLTGVVGLDPAYPVALAGQLVAGCAALIAGGQVWGRGRRLPGAALLAVGAALTALAVAWALAGQVPTLVALPVAAAALAVAAWRCGGTASIAAPRLPLAVLAGLAAVAEVAAATRAGGGGWPAVAALTLAVTCAGAAAAALVVPDPVRHGLVVAATMSGLADVLALTAWRGGSAGDAGLALAVAAGALLASGVTVLPWLAPGAVPAAVLRDVCVPAALGTALGVLLCVGDAERLWLALLAAGVAAGVVAVRPQLHQVGWLAGVLLTASSWVRLALSHVDAPEPYTVPAGALLVALGALRRHRDPDYPSWRAYATGLGLALVPSLARAVTDTGTVRPLLLALAALAVLATGVARRLQAPLAIGGAVLAVDALVQLSPYLAAVYDAVPRWTAFAVAGLLLLGVGATYEQRAREVRALRHRVSRFG